MAYLDVRARRLPRSRPTSARRSTSASPTRQLRDVKTKLILSTRLRAATARPRPQAARRLDAPRARSSRSPTAPAPPDNLDLFELTRGSPKPTIALGMGEFGLMSRVLAPKFSGYLTFASLRDTAVTAPGSPHSTTC
ncbi:MAG: type I 3-dehydroquinate dehydratase [Phycisphaeraceae bacterium]|nr:type I 3-dehydroquinate dehydratase [Phycisphaeraceae bacterium]